MYEKYFGLSEKPFAITPNPRFLYLSDKHREGLAHLLYGTDESGSFVLLTGEVGTGKTLLCRSLLEQDPQGVSFALILNPLQTPLELLASICDEFAISYPAGNGSQKVLVDSLNRFLLDEHGKGRQSVVVIDEAQNLDIKTLEQVRLLTNLETGTHKLLKIILIGQPELKTILSRPELRQLAQRITARYHLEPLSLQETTAYVRHHLKVAGAANRIFKPGALRQLQRISKGIPRMINLISDRALTGAYALDREKVDSRLLRKAANELLADTRTSTPGWSRQPAIVSGILLAGAGLLFFLLAKNNPQANDSTTLTHSVPAKFISQSDEKSPPKNLLDYLRSSDSASPALNQLFDYWGYDLGNLRGESSCERATEIGLKCLYANGSIEDIRRYNRPVVLELKDDADQVHQVLVAGIQRNSLALKFAPGEQEFERAEIESYWNGDYLLLWRPPPGGAINLQQGQSGPDVVWLKQQLDLAIGAEANSQDHSSLFDEDLRQRIIAFQSNQNLKADGIAGEETLIALATIIGRPDTPLLFAVKERR